MSCLLYVRKYLRKFCSIIPQFKVEFGGDLDRLKKEEGFTDLVGITGSSFASMNSTFLLVYCKLLWELEVSAANWVMNAES